MLETLRKTMRYDCAIDDVWTALTDRRALAEWLMPNDFSPIEGREFSFQVDPMGSFSGVNACVVLEVQAPRRLAYTWCPLPRDPEAPRPLPMVVTWTLEQGDSGTRLTLEQTGLGHLSLLWRVAMYHGWRRMLRTLLPRVLRHVRNGVFTPGAIMKRDYRASAVPETITK